MSLESLRKELAPLQHEFLQDQLVVQGHSSAPVSQGTATLLKTKMDTWYPRFEVLRNKLFAKAYGTGDYEEVANELGTLPVSWTNSMGKLMDIILAHNQRAAPPPPQPTPTAPQGGKLPDLAVPAFSGDLQEWMAFADLFKSAIHTNTRLTNAARLQYLKLYLKDEALQLISAMPVTDGNYPRAWTLLEERYQNTRKLVYSLISRLTHLPSAHSGHPRDLRKLVDATSEIVQQLRELQQPVDQWHAVTTTILGEKLDDETRRAWNRTLTQAIPDFVAMVKFLNDRIDADLDAGDRRPKKATEGGKKKAFSNLASSSSTPSSTPSRKCPLCQDPHSIYQCPPFLEKPAEGRAEIALKVGLCLNCLGGGHNAAKCQSKHTCRTCSSRHHSLLHKDGGPHAATLKPNPAGPPVALHLSDFPSGPHTTLLATAIVQIEDPNGRLHSVRALLDGGSQISCITEQCAHRLNLPQECTRTQIFGLQSTAAGVSTGVAHFNVTTAHPGNEQVVVPVAAVTVKNITGHQPTCTILPQQLFHLRGLQLADPNFSKPAAIDLLLGADTYPAIMLEGKRTGPRGTPTAFQTIFGWTLMGKVSARTAKVYAHHVTTSSLESTLQKFWQLEELNTKVLSPEEKEGEKHFLATHSREANGRYVVRLPFKVCPKRLGLSRKAALRRWLQEESRLKRNTDKEQQYSSFLTTMLSMGHMLRVPPHQQLEDGPSTYYLPHHAVINAASTSTQLRVVFDASAKTTSGASLNDTLLVGAWVQDELLDHLLRFRFHHVALVADIVKMFRQVKVHPDDWNFQRIIWRPSESPPPLSYWLTTVVYGQASSPFLATRALNQLAEDEAKEFPEACSIVLRDFYVDNLIGGASSPEAAKGLVLQIIQLLDRGQLPLKKWMSSSEEVLQSIPPECRETQSLLDLTDSEGMKTLGVHWNPRTDSFIFSVQHLSHHPETKREILSDIATVFDPLGWLSPVTINAKMVMQALWAEQADWDAKLPTALLQRWTAYRTSLTEVEKIHIPRCVVPPAASSYVLHGFSDASEKAYAAVVYLLAGTAPPHLLIAKTKVAPVKRTTVPRLELCGALLLAKLMSTVTRALVKLESGPHEAFAWTDSTIVLAWISSNANRWSTFVGNRVAQIQELLSPPKWNHVRTEDNPADEASRGITPAALLSSSLWWHGPAWLSTIDMTLNHSHPRATTEEERRNLHLTTGTPKCPTTTFLEAFSLISKLLRVSALIRRKLFKPAAVGPPTASELHSALLAWVTQVQDVAFHLDISSLRTTGKVSHRSQLVCLHPFLDTTGILRVNGRLARAPVSQDQRQPILLPKNSHLTMLIIQREHHRLLHAGQQQVRASLQQQYWIPAGQATIRKVIRRCLICAKASGTLQQQLMGALPLHRVSSSPPFLITGVDYAGPFELRVQKVRGQARYKAYACIFVCLSTKAVHLEAVSDLTTDGFLGALQRFTSTRGKPKEILSDNGTNFYGASNQLKEWYRYLQQPEASDLLTTSLAEEGIQWHFIPPAAPHMGGLWEAAVKSMKHHLQRIYGEASLTYEHFTTVLKRVEAVLNSRPLCPASTDPRDLEPLTPGHFLIGRALTSWPEPDVTQLNPSRLSQWQHVQQLSQHFWTRWSREYLSSLQARPKGWTKEKVNLAAGDLVLIQQENLPPLKWKMGRVTATHPGTDGLVRVVTVKTADGKTFQRPIVKLCLLPVEKPENSE